jgi:hypothetical protein
MENQKKKLTKSEYLKEVKESMSEIRPKTTSYDLNTHGGFQRAKILENSDHVVKIFSL